MEFVKYNEESEINTPVANNSTYPVDNSPYVLVLERADSSIGVIDEDVFEGTAAVLDVMNDNRRIYTKDEYLTHLPYLQEKIKRGRLFGEIDHPQGYYDVRLQNISHKIEALWYDEPSNTIKIRIRLLRGTPGGDFARKLVELGIPLAISSRAVGKVVDNHPQILRIFTFDLVAEPGFRDSILHPSSSINYNESLKENLQYLTESLNNCESNSILNQCELLYENKNFEDYLQIYKINNEKVIEELDALFENRSDIAQNNSTNMDQKEFVAYTEKISKEFSGVKNMMGKINEDLQEVQNQISNAQQQPQIQPTSQIQPTVQTGQGGQAQDVTELPNMSEDDTAEEALEKLKTYVDFMSREIELLGSNQMQLQESLNSQNATLHTIGKAVNRTINHENRLAKKLNESLNFIELEILPTLNENADTTNIQSYLITKMIEMGDHLSDKTNDALNYGNFLGSVSEAHAGFMNMMAEGKGFDKTVKGNKIMSINESTTEETSGEDANASKDKTGEETKTVNETVAVPESKPTEPITESTTEENNDTSPKAVFEGIQTTANKILERIDENSTISVLKKQYPFLNLLESANQERFFNLDNETKKNVVDALNKGVYFNQNDVVSIMEAVVSSQGKNLPNHIRFMPDEFKGIYENLNESKKREIDIMADSGLYRLDSPYNVKTFWHSLGINESLNRLNQQNLKDQKKTNEEVVNLNESKQEIPVEKRLEYDANYVNAILKRRY